MTIYSEILAYPDGDTQEASRNLQINQLVDLNGVPVGLPLPTVKMIVYRVFKITVEESTGEQTKCYHLELVRREEMLEYV